MATVDEPTQVKADGDDHDSLNKDDNASSNINDNNEESTKRKASPDDDLENTAKRARHDEDGDVVVGGAAAPDTPAPDSHTAPAQSPEKGDVSLRSQKTAVLQEERKRGKRLFGGLLNTLSKSSTAASPHQKRRLEIESRQRERLRQQQDADEQKRAENSARLLKIRAAKEIIWEEEVMRYKHDTMMEKARQLRTQARPHLYYLPYKLTDEEHDIIDDQIDDAREQIERELREFDARKQRHDERHGTRRRSSVDMKSPEDAEGPAGHDDAPPKDQEAARGDAGSPKPGTAAQAEAAPTRSPVDDDHDDHQKSPHNHQNHHHHDHHDDVMVQAGDDMVMY